MLYNDGEVGGGKYFLPSMYNMDVEFDAFTADGDVTILYMGFPLLGKYLLLNWLKFLIYPIFPVKKGHNPALPIGQNLTYSCPEGQRFTDNWNAPPKVTIRCAGAAGNFSRPSSWAWPTCSARESGDQVLVYFQAILMLS